MFGLGLLELFVLVLIVAIGILPFWRIFGKAGFTPALSLLMVIPLVNIIMLFYLAFAPWPALGQSRKP